MPFIFTDDSFISEGTSKIDSYLDDIFDATGTINKAKVDEVVTIARNGDLTPDELADLIAKLEAKADPELAQSIFELKASKWWHPEYVDNLDGTQMILGIKQSVEGLSTLGSATRSTAMTTGLDWVGEGYKEMLDGAGNLIGYSSADGMKAFRIQFKNAENMWRANFTENIKVMTQGGETIKQLKYVHIDILD